MEKGTIGAFSRAIHGMRDGKAVMSRTSILYATRNVEPDWDLRDSGQYLRVDGDAPLEISFTNPAKGQTKAHGSSGLTANPVVNAIPYICAAPPGIVETRELPAMTGWFGS